MAHAPLCISFPVRVICSLAPTTCCACGLDGEESAVDMASADRLRHMIGTPHAATLKSKDGWIGSAIVMRSVDPPSHCPAEHTAVLSIHLVMMIVHTMPCPTTNTAPANPH